MSENRDIIFKLRKLIDDRQRTKSLELDGELKKEQRLLNRAISLLQYGFALEQEILELELEKTEELPKSQNNAPNRDLDIVTGNEE
jgi:hypothetical protein